MRVTIWIDVSPYGVFNYLTRPIYKPTASVKRYRIEVDVPDPGHEEEELIVPQHAIEETDHG